MFWYFKAKYLEMRQFKSKIRNENLSKNSLEDNFLNNLLTAAAQSLPTTNLLPKFSSKDLQNVFKMPEQIVGQFSIKKVFHSIPVFR